jgi:hypothetical protein
MTFDRMHRTWGPGQPKFIIHGNTGPFQPAAYYI